MPGKNMIQRPRNKDDFIGVPVHSGIPEGWKPGTVCPGKAAHMPDMGFAAQMGQIPAHTDHSFIGVIQIKVVRQRLIQPFCFELVQYRG